MDQESKATDLEVFLRDLEGGVFHEKVSHALSDVALGVVLHGKVGKVTLTFDMKRIGESTQVTIDHKLSTARPTRNGKMSEDNTTQTPMHVGKGGKLSLFMPQQKDMFTRSGEPSEA